MFHRFVFPALMVTCAAAQEKVTFDGQVLPVFQQACLNCHNPDKAKGGLDLSTFSGTLKGSSGGKVVEPGDLSSSLIKAVEHSGGPKMPPEGEKLPAAHIQTLKRWIEAGLLENSSSSARKATRPKFDFSPSTDPMGKPDGPPAMPSDLLLEPVLTTPKGSAVRALASSPWAPLLAVTGQRQVLLYHSETFELLGVLPFSEGDPVSLAFSPDGRHLIVGGGVPGKSGVTVTFDITRGTRVLVVGKEFDSVLAADIRPGFDLVATGGPSRLLKLWDTGSGDARRSIKKHTDWITALDFSPDGVLLASGDRNGGVWVWESHSGSEFHTLRAHQAAIRATVFRADSNILATSSEDGTVRFWEMNGGSEVRKIDAHPGGVTAFCFARDGGFLTVGRDFKARLWKPDFNPARELSGKLPALPVSAALDADGRIAFIGDADGRVLAIHTADGKQAGEFSNNLPSIQTRLRDLEATIGSKQQELSSAELALKKAKEVPGDPQAEKQVADARIVRDAFRASIDSLEQSRKRWSAAAINTRAIAAREALTIATAALVESQDDWIQAALEIARRAEFLGLKRAQRARLASVVDQEGLSADALVELGNTLLAVDGVIEDARLALGAGEDALVKARDAADRLAQHKRDEGVKANELANAYRKALE